MITLHDSNNDRPKLPRGILYPEEVEDMTRFSAKFELPLLAKHGVLVPLAYEPGTNTKKLYALIEVQSFLASMPRMLKARKICMHATHEKNSRRGRSGQ